MIFKTHRSPVWRELIVLSVLVVWSLSPSASLADVGANGIARKVAGTWLFDPASDFQVLMNINADGRLIWSNSVEYNPAFPNGAVFGVWTRTGKREITTSELGFLYDANGVHVFTGRVRQVFRFDREFQSISAEFTEDIFTPDQDPTDPSEVPLFTFGGDGIVARRLPAPAPVHPGNGDDD